MERTSESDRGRVWDLIKDAHTALLVTMDDDGAPQARPMGCLQREFDGTLFFLTFQHSSKLRQVREDDRLLVAYERSLKTSRCSASSGPKDCGSGFPRDLTIQNLPFSPLKSRGPTIGQIRPLSSP